MSRKRTAVILVLTIMFGSSACNLQLDAPASREAVATAVEQTMIAKTNAANIVAMSPIAMTIDTPVFTIAPTRSALMVSVSLDTNCRSGPGTAYDYVGSLLVGETTEVLGRDSSGQFWVVRNPDVPGTLCWLWDQYATLTGDWQSLPVATPPPTPTSPATPTSQPGFTFAFKTVERCVNARLIEFAVTNTGAVTWESYKLFVKDTTLSLSDTISDDRFPDVHDCGCDYYDLALVPGQTGSLGSRPFIDHHPSGEAFYAELTLCTQNGLTGQCVTKSITFTVP